MENTQQTVTPTAVPPITQPPVPVDNVSDNVTDALLGQISSDGIVNATGNIPVVGGILRQSNIVEQGLEQSGVGDQVDSLGEKIQNFIRPAVDFVMKPVVWVVSQIPENLRNPIVNFLPLPAAIKSGLTSDQSSDQEVTAPATPQPSVSPVVPAPQQQPERVATSHDVNEIAAPVPTPVNPALAESPERARA